MTSKISVDEANTFLSTIFMTSNQRTTILQMEAGRAVQRYEISKRDLRPGGFISGPTQMGMADGVAYFAVLSLIGMQPMAVTSSLNINFLRPCIGKALIAEAEVIKLGKSLAVIEVGIRTEDAEKPSSHAVVTYALPKPGASLAGEAGTGTK